MENLEFKLTEEQEKEFRWVKSHFPFRIIWIEFHSENNFHIHASHNRREMNKSARKGNKVFQIK